MSYVDGRRSNFPNDGVDQFLELYNLPVSQRGNMKRYQELKLKENLSPSEQSESNSLTVALQHYIIDVEKWNKFADAIVNVENFFLNETVGFVNDKQAEMNSYVNIKKDELVEKQNETVGFVNDKKLEFQTEVDKLTYRGEWQPNTQYHKKNVVTSGGEGFIAKVDSVNQSPPSATYWGKIANKGSKGDPSLNINFKGEYNVGTPYVMGDAITFGGLWYYAKQNTSGNPPTNQMYWELQTNQTMVSDVEPFDNRVTLWINTGL